MEAKPPVTTGRGEGTAGDIAFGAVRTVGTSATPKGAGALGAGGWSARADLFSAWAPPESGGGTVCFEIGWRQAGQKMSLRSQSGTLNTFPQSRQV